MNEKISIMNYPLTEIEKDIRPEDFREDSVWREIAEKCGASAIFLLTKRCGGTKVYVPEYDTIMRQARKRELEREVARK